MKFLISIIFLFVFANLNIEGRFQVRYQWRSIGYRNLPATAIYNSTHPVPYGMAIHKNRIYLGVPRRNSGVSSTLNYISMNDLDQEPRLTPYPTFEMNRYAPGNSPEIVSVYRPRVDNCDRLWFVDTGVMEFPNNRIVVKRPSVWVINLNGDILIRRFEIPVNLVETGRGLVSLTVDDPDGTCQDAFAYITDWFTSNLIVYSLSQNRAWKVEHNYFFFDPMYGNFNVGGYQFSRRDGLFSIALSHRLSDGQKIAFFHSMCTDAEFVVSTKILRNETLATRTFHGNDFKLLGRRGSTKHQAGMHLYDSKTRIMFTTQLQRNAIDCWRFDIEFSTKYTDTVDQDDETLYYPVDMIIDNDSALWVLTNKMPRVIYGSLNYAENNFYILRANVKDIISGSKCDVRSIIGPDENNFDSFCGHRVG